MNFYSNILQQDISGNKARSLVRELITFTGKLCTYVKMEPHPTLQNASRITFECGKAAQHTILYVEGRATVSEPFRNGVAFYCHKHAVRTIKRMNNEQKKWKEDIPDIKSPQLKTLVKKSKKVSR